MRKRKRKGGEKGQGKGGEKEQGEGKGKEGENERGGERRRSHWPFWKWCVYSLYYCIILRQNSDSVSYSLQYYTNQRHPDSIGL